MTLTPEDIVSKRFQPTKFREGYDQDEVDDFLDQVVVEFRRVTADNDELRQRLLASEARIAELQRSGAGLVEQITTPAVSAASVVDPASNFPVAIQDPVMLDSSNTNNLLQLARKLHDEHVREGLEKRDQLIQEGHTAAARLIREAEASHRADVIRLSQEKAIIENEIQQLKSFEREYRIKLKTFIESQLSDLAASEQHFGDQPSGFNAITTGEISLPPSATGYGFTV